MLVRTLLGIDLLVALAVWPSRGRAPRRRRPTFRVIQWDFTRICQIYDFGWGGRPIPSNYRVLTPPLPSFRAAVRAKSQLARHGRCSI